MAPQRSLRSLGGTLCLHIGTLALGAAAISVQSDPTMVVMLAEEGAAGIP